MNNGEYCPAVFLGNRKTEKETRKALPVSARLVLQRNKLFETFLSVCRFVVVQIIVVLKCRVITDWTKKESSRFKINATWH